MENALTMMRAAMQRMGDGERWWAAEFAVRGLGLLAIALCAALILWLFRSLNRPFPHDARPLDYAAALLGVMCWWFGWAFALVGPGLFKRVPLPARSWHPMGRH